jgi:predicted RNA-binding protein YlqC (UPF0109 family)
VTDLYEAGDINQTDGGGHDDVNDADNDGDFNEYGDDGGNEGNEVSELDGGTPLAVLNYLARSLSNDPDAVVIDTEERRGGMRLSLHVAPDDMGRVIGRRGRTAQAIRTLVNVAGAKDGVQASVDIVDD